MRPIRPVPVALGLLLAALLLASPALGYIVVLKDGTQLSTRTKPEIRDGKAYFTLSNGTESFLDANEIDVARTEELNQVDYGTARVIDAPPAAPPPSLPQDDETSLSDLARRSSLSRPEARRREDDAVDLGPLPRTAAGFVDLMEVRRREHPDAELTAELARILRGQGYDRVAVYQGTAADRVLLDLPANSEAAVFKGLRDTAQVLAQLRDRFGDRLAALELLMATTSGPRRTRAGQFVITPELAALLNGGEMEPDDFFLQYVQF